MSLRFASLSKKSQKVRPLMSNTQANYFSRSRNANLSHLYFIQTSIHRGPCACRFWTKRKIGAPRLTSNKYNIRPWLEIFGQHCLNWPITIRECVMLYSNLLCDWSIQTIRTNDFEPCLKQLEDLPKLSALPGLIEWKRPFPTSKQGWKF